MTKLETDTYELEVPKLNPGKDEKGEVKTHTLARPRRTPGPVLPCVPCLLQAGQDGDRPS